MRAVRADAPEEAGEERRDADPPLLEGERDVGMRGMLTGMFSKLLSQVGVGTQVGEERRVAAVEELAAVSDEEWEAADFQDADLEERVAVEIIERAWKGYRMRRFLRSRVRWKVSFSAVYLRESAATSIAAAWRGFAVRGGWLCRAMKLTYAECMKGLELREAEIDNREAMCLSSWELREDELNNREEELLDFERQLDTEVECRRRGGLICDVCNAQMEAGSTTAISVVGVNVDFCVDCVVEEALSRVTAGDAGKEMPELSSSELLKFAFHAVPFEMTLDDAPWQPPVEATDRPPPTNPTHPLRRTDGPQPGGHGSPQSGGHSGPRTGGYQTKQDKRKAKKARQKAKRRAAQAPSAAMEHSSPPASPPASLTSSPCRLDGQEAKQPSGGRRPNTAKHRTTQEAGGVPGAPLTPAARSSSPTAAAAAAAPSPS